MNPDPQFPAQPPIEPSISACGALDSKSPIWQRPGMEITASSLKLRADAPEGRKAISYQT